MVCFSEGSIWPSSIGKGVVGVKIAFSTIALHSML